MSTYCDLHTHSTYSDGTFTPKQLIEEGERIGLSHLVLSDHNSIDGLDEFFNSAKGKKITPIAGVELSSEYNGGELHILGLFLDAKSYSKINQFTSEYANLKEQSNINLCEKLNANGYEIDYQKLKLSTPKGKVNRAVIAGELLKNGKIDSISSAFSGILSQERGFYIPPKRPSSLKTIQFLSSIGAVPVLAHPFLNLDYYQIKQFLPLAKEVGLKAMETLYSGYSEQTTSLAISLAKEFNLKQSGGSDFHGENKPDIRLGKGRGNLKIPTELVYKLQS